MKILVLHYRVPLNPYTSPLKIAVVLNRGVSLERAKEVAWQAVHNARGTAIKAKKDRGETLEIVCRSVKRALRKIGRVNEYEDFIIESELIRTTTWK